MNNPQPYQLQIGSVAKRELARLDPPVAKRIMKKLYDLAANAETTSHFALSGEWKGLYRIRIGDYRVIYDLQPNKLVILVVAVGHRSSIYKR